LVIDRSLTVIVPMGLLMTSNRFNAWQRRHFISMQKLSAAFASKALQFQQRISFIIP